MAGIQSHLEHLLRRAGFGAGEAELQAYQGKSTFEAISTLLDGDGPDDVDAKMGQQGYATFTPRGQGAFSPGSVVDDARQRWLFRMVHSQRPLHEKMALFWHNHFATAYSKVAGTFGAVHGAKMMALKQGELPGPQGQIEMFREKGLGSFRDLLIAVAQDPAMLVWLDGRTNTRQRPQENFGREIMELFTLGVGHYTEEDVYAAARVFTGWNLRFVNNGEVDANNWYEFQYVPERHDPTAKAFTFPIYRDGSTTIPPRAAGDGMQDGIDFINALATHPATAERLARKMWRFFVSELTEPDEEFLRGAASIYLSNGTRIKPLVQYVLQSRAFQNPGHWHERYSWPVEYVVRAAKEVGFLGLSVDTLRSSLVAMGQILYEPPDVAGWELGPGWFSTGAMLARINYASALASNQRFELARAAAGANASADTVLEFFLGRLPAPFDSGPVDELRAYLLNGGAWTGSATQLQTKCPGLVRLIVGSAEYQVM